MHVQVCASTSFGPSPAQVIVSALDSRGGMAIGSDEAHRLLTKTGRLTQKEALSDTFGL